MNVALNRGELGAVANAEVLKRNHKTLVERIPQPQFGGYATIEPREDGFAVGTLEYRTARVSQGVSISRRLKIPYTPNSPGARCFFRLLASSGPPAAYY